MMVENPDAALGTKLPPPKTPASSLLPPQEQITGRLSQDLKRSSKTSLSIRVVRFEKEPGQAILPPHPDPCVVVVHVLQRRGELSATVVNSLFLSG